MYELKKNKPKLLIWNVSEEQSANVGLVKGEHRDVWNRPRLLQFRFLFIARFHFLISYDAICSRNGVLI